ncbi:MAG TPA: acyl-CoA dehydrogenase family protein, partial [Streptosporangiaceae bacterium]|nr:acyl-CoA dehydrogenase family protein [Streptosporangiaceae bacterium]
MTSTVELRAAIPASQDEALAIATELAAAFRDGAARRDAELILPGDEVEEMTRRGLYGLTVPAWLGGSDLPMSAVAEVLRILATGDPNLAQLPHSHYVYVNLLRCCGSRDQQRELLSAVRDGARFGNAQAEAGTRTPDQIRTTIVPDGSGYVITGEKFYCTGAWFAHIIPVLARGQ